MVQIHPYFIFMISAVIPKEIFVFLHIPLHIKVTVALQLLGVQYVAQGHFRRINGWVHEGLILGPS